MPLFIHNKTDKSLYIVRQRVTLLTPLPKFAAASKSLHETLFADGVKIEIPDYQREFSWEQDRLELFYDDLIAPKPEVKSGKFCGTTLRLDLDEGLPMELIDGQQRTTVAHLVMATLRDIAMDHEDCFGIAMTVQNDLEVGPFSETSNLSAGSKAKFKFAAGRGSREYFKDNVLACPEQGNQEALQARLTGNIEPPKGREQKRIRDAYKYFHFRVAKSIKDREEGKSVWDVLEEIRKKLRELRVVDIVVYDDDVKFEIFEAVNARGLSLRPADLIKNHLMSKDRIHRDLILEEWDRCNAECDIEDSSSGNLLTEIIRYYWNSTHSYTTQNKLFDRVRKHVTSKNDGTARDFTLEIGKAVDSYWLLKNNGTKEQLTSGIAHSKSKNVFFQNVDVLRQQLSLKSHWVLFLTLLRHQKEISDKSLANIAEQLNRFCIAHFCLAKLAGGSAERLFAKLAWKLDHAFVTGKKGDKNRAVDNTLKLLAEAWPEKSAVELGLKELEYEKTPKARSTIRAVLATYEMNLSSNSAIGFDWKNVNIEHVQPLKPEDNEVQEEFREHVNKLGNLVLWNESDNKSAGNDSPLDKKVLLDKSSLIHTRDVADLIEKSGGWKTTDIGDRHDKLVRELVELFGEPTHS